MSFKLTQSATFKAPVKFQVRGEDGKPIDSRFTGIFHRKTQTEIDAMFAASMRDDQVIAETLAGWEDGPLADDNTPLAFNPENLELVTNRIHGIKAVITATFFDNNSAASRKN